jgi:hypothetical protein
MDAGWSICRSAKSTFTAAAAGIEPATGRLTVAFPYQHGTHRNNKSGRLDLNQRSRAPEARAVFPGNTGQTFPRPELKERPAGIEPALPPWQDSTLPLHHGRYSVTTRLSESESTGPDSNRRPRITGAESWPLDDQCLCFSWRGGSWTHDLRLIRTLLSPLSYARAPTDKDVRWSTSRAGGS